MEAAPQEVHYDREGPLAILTLDRPSARNAYSEAMCAELCQALDRAERDDDVRCVVLTGAGPAFHAGGDIKAMRERSGMFAGDPAELRARYVRGIQAVPRRIAECEKPLLAAINGPAIGAGLDLACMCDLRLASDHAAFGSTFARIGLVPGDGGAFFLARVVGFPRALELMLTARMIEPEEALRIGLVHEVVPLRELMARAKAKALEIAEHPPLAVRLTKRAAYQSWNRDVAVALELAATYQGIAQNHKDHLDSLGTGSPGRR
ncbi:MAG: enoyl-CoA hydratase-related protein [Planctomycetota bacterium]